MFTRRDHVWRITSRGGASSSKEKDVILVAPSLGYNGQLMYWEPIISALVGLLPSLKVITQSKLAAGYSYLPIIGPKVGWTKASSFATGRSYSQQIRSYPSVRLLTELVRLPLDLMVIIEFAPLSIFGALLALCRRRPYVVLVESDPKFRGARQSTLTRGIKRMICSFSEGVMTNGPLGEDYLKTIVKARGQVVVRPYLTSEPPRSEVPSASRVADGRIRFLFLNSVSTRKGIHELLAGFEWCVEECGAQNIELDVVGDGDCLEDVESNIAHSIRGRVRFHGKIEYGKVRSFYEACDVVVCPSRMDYRSLGVFEAINSGRPVIGSMRDGSAIEAIEHGHNGFRIDPTDGRSLREALLWFADHPNEIRRMSMRSQEVSQAYTTLRVARNLADFIEASSQA